MVIEAAKKADPGIFWWPYAEALDPNWALTQLSGVEPPMQALWINHHDGLHSRWTRDHLRQFKQRGVKVLLTYHDTRERLVDCPKLAALAGEADHVIVHEPVEGLTMGKRFTYLRQGIPERRGCYVLNHQDFGGWNRPVLGTVGWNFPWKNYDRLCALTAEIGWGVLLLCNNATEEDITRWGKLNPWLVVHGGFLPTSEIVARLAGCTATAFMYECANTGTSGAIRLGVAARKPVYALESCRQFRDLHFADHATRFGRLLNWVETWADLRNLLIHSWPVDCDPAMVYLAERDSMDKVGQRYAQILRGL